MCGLAENLVTNLNSAQLKLKLPVGAELGENIRVMCLVLRTYFFFPLHLLISAIVKLMKHRANSKQFDGINSFLFLVYNFNNTRYNI